MKLTVSQILARMRQTHSMSESRRLIVMGLVKVNDRPINDISEEIDFQVGDVITFARREVVVRAQDVED